MTISRRNLIGLMAAGGITSALPMQGLLASDPVSPQSDKPWRPLLNGKNLDGWTYFLDNGDIHADQGTLEFKDDVLHVLGAGYTGPNQARMGYIATVEEFENYHLSLDYKWGTRRYAPRELFKRDSGLLYHTPSGKDYLWPDCVEYQIMEYNTGDALPVNHRAIQAISMGGMPAWPRNFPGNTRYAPQVDAGGNLRQAIKADGYFDSLTEWNTIELIASGDSAAHIVNGRIVTALYGLQAQNPDDRSQYVPLTKGRILLQIEGAEIMFRNVKIRAL